MPLSEEAFTFLVDAGCPDCRNKRLAIEALVTQTVPLLGGEPFGAPSWGYKGQDLVVSQKSIARGFRPCVSPRWGWAIVRRP
jgi:hypothetical protein